MRLSSTPPYHYFLSSHSFSLSPHPSSLSFSLSLHPSSLSTTHPYLCYLSRVPPTGYVSLSMDGLVTVTNRSVAALVCTVVHNSSQVSTFFYINNTKLTTSNALQMDRSLRVEYYDHCYQPPSQGQCEELSLLIRVNPALNNTKISCRTRARDSTDTSLHTSPEEVTIIVGDPGMLIYLTH